ncbi:Armadillo-type fold,Coatomer, gamma subunit, appendage, Ig-like subdomain,Clathrin/coatomer adaptor [Cinara cedri]|uniref:Coatomer subunit gamma n=2 Tax=Cinara cedri TaxID=506608 RepID=A0A5E4NIV1_9HEMI|nr:Armadillo-type fold,Coatomer, gamma subunit, appendage, Ig-like subdomain,Clathrin/coatomer adaptor [Cinara cedri]
MAFKRDKKEEEDGGNPYQNLEKTSVLQEARTFNDTPVNPRKCTHILSKILYMINQGEQLGTAEATETFFAMTKLFQSRDIILRRMVYLGIKELSGIAEDVIIVTSSLTKDMTGKEDTYRAAAIRALCSITDVSMLQTIERYMKQAIVDKNPGISSAALVSCLHLCKNTSATDIVKRSLNEIQEALNSDNVMVQYHALGLLFHLRKSDRLAVTKLVAKLTKSNMKSPFAVCMLIRMACKLLEEETIPRSESALFEFVESCIRHKSETVVYEAAHAIVHLSGTGARHLAPAVSVLQLFCSSAKPTLRFAAVRTLNKVAMEHPTTVTACNLDLENLISDSNRSVATLAITTLLKTGAEASIDRLMKQIATFVNEISDEFKIVVVQAIRALCSKFPRKHTVLMNFLSGMLREEGGLEYKASIADTIIAIIEENPEAKETGLAHLCEFIEDCEHTSLTVRILHLLGKEGPRTKQPSRYIRFIYNRVILEGAVVRAAAVGAMAKYAANCSMLHDSIKVLLKRCCLDVDDEVRDRATFYSQLLSSNNSQLITDYLSHPMHVSLPVLEKTCQDYVINPTKERINLNELPADTVIKNVGISQEPIKKHTVDNVKPVEASVKNVDGQKLSALLDLNVGNLFCSSDSSMLTEAETEYVVRCTKHIFNQHLVLQFEITNTLDDQILENISIALDISEGFQFINEFTCPSIKYQETGNVYVCLKFPDDSVDTIASFTAKMKFIVKDCDPITGEVQDDGYQEDYRLEDVEMTLKDQMLQVKLGNWDTLWEEAKGVCFEVQETFALPLTDGGLSDTINQIISFLGMAAANNTDNVHPPNKSSHIVNLAGMMRGNCKVLAQAKLALSDNVVNIQLTVRSMDERVAELVVSTLD